MIKIIYLMKKSNNIFWLIIAFYVSTNLVLSCNPAKQLARKQAKEEAKQKKKVAEAKAIFAQNPLEFAADCGRQFPPAVFDSTSAPVLEVAKGKKIGTVNNVTENNITQTLIAMLKISNDSVRQKIIDSLQQHPVIIKGDCPPVYIYAPDTVKSKQDHFRTVANTATEEALRRDVQDYVKNLAIARQKNVSLTADKETYKKWALRMGIGNGIFIILLVIGIILHVKGKISFL